MKPVDRAAKALIRKYSRWWCDHCDRVIAPTAKSRDLLRGYGVCTPIDIVPTGIDFSRFAPERHPQAQRQEIRRECGVLPEEQVLLYIGRLSS